MSKIIQAVNSMISNANLIDSVIQGSNDKELFFIYKNKYKWSMTTQDDGNYSLWFYPNSISLKELSQIDGPDWEHITMINYSTKDLLEKEAKQSFVELYRVLKEKVFGMDSVLDDIIKDMDMPF